MRVFTRMYASPAQQGRARHSNWSGEVNEGKVTLTSDGPTESELARDDHENQEDFRREVGDRCSRDSGLKRVRAAPRVFGG
jgi:hypothetical protein